MQKTCNRESYALSPRKELSLFLTENRVQIIKKPTMITPLSERSIKELASVKSKERFSHVPATIFDRRPKERYYSLLVLSEGQTRPFTSVVHDLHNDILRVTMANMAIYECYLFALGLPANFPKEQIIVYGYDRARYVQYRYCQYFEKLLFDYELAVPADTGIDVYRQCILNDLNKHLQLDVRVEQLPIVKGSRPIVTGKGESVELIWGEQPTMIVKTKGAGD